MTIIKTLGSLGLTLPALPAPAANYVPALTHGKLVFISGQLPFLNGEIKYTGRVGDTLSLEQGIEAARACALNILAQINDVVQGDWSKVERCVKLGGFVACVPDFTAQPKIINGASDLMIAVMGDAGRHTRFAVGAPSLPMGAAVEIEAIFALR